MNKIYTDSKKKINVCRNISIRIFRLTKAVIRLKEIIRLEEIDKRIKTKVNNVRRLKNLVSS
jgi:predicted transcriptional regulator